MFLELKIIKFIFRFLRETAIPMDTLPFLGIPWENNAPLQWGL